MTTAALPHPKTIRPRMHRTTPSLSHYQTTPISKHYQVNQQILSAFQSSYDQKMYQVAYAFGLKFVETALLEIPKHGYYFSRRHEQDRMNSALEAVRVSRILQEIQQEQQDDQSSVSSLEQQVRVSKLADLAIHQVQEASEDQYERQRAETEFVLQQQHDSDWIVCEPFLTCHESLSSIICPQQQQQHDASSPVVGPVVATDIAASLHPFDEEPTPVIAKAKATLVAVSEESKEVLSEEPTRDLLLDNLPAVATAIPIGQQRSQTLAMSPSSSKTPTLWYDQVQLTKSISEDLMLEKALYLSGLEVSHDIIVEGKEEEEELVPTTIGPPSLKRQHSRLELATVSTLYHQDFDQLRKVGRIRIGYARTYQGRLPGSVNGCTVIAPLLCIHHLVEDTMPDPGLSDNTIVHVIDNETPAILQELRDKLHLSSQAFLIPSDAHDYLIDNGQLSQEQFVNVIGGNILDDAHIHHLMELLEKAPHRRLCATLFFHEHVVAILKLQRDDKTCWYDWIDSLPLKETLAKPSETEHEFNRRLGLSDSEEELSEAFLPMTCRIRCMHADALKATIRWYACSKFTDENHSYIDNYAWDDTQSDFDQRVFQAFVWGECS